MEGDDVEPGPLVRTATAESILAKVRRDRVALSQNGQSMTGQTTDLLTVPNSIWTPLGDGQAQP
jgi:hypothetical protein